MDKKIYLTIDIECHDLKRKNQYIDGKCGPNKYGLEYILELAKEYDVPVNCFLDIPEANEYGESYIEEIITLISKYNQHVYLHLHPDYVTGDHEKTFLWEYSDDEKRTILQKGFQMYEKHLGQKAAFFRVGRYGADVGMYRILDELGLHVFDLSYCSKCPKMCHVDEKDINVYNKVTKYYGNVILPNTRYLGLKIGKKRVYINLDTSDTTFDEYKRILGNTKLTQLVLTMHSWNFIKKYFFNDEYVALDKYAERKFRKMISYAKKRGYVFADLKDAPPMILQDEVDEIMDLCKRGLDFPKMLLNNFIRFKRIGRLNKKYFCVYLLFYLLSVFLLALVVIGFLF